MGIIEWKDMIDQAERPAQAVEILNCMHARDAAMPIYRRR